LSERRESKPRVEAPLVREGRFGRRETKIGREQTGASDTGSLRRGGVESKGRLFQYREKITRPIPGARIRDRGAVRKRSSTGGAGKKGGHLSFWGEGPGAEEGTYQQANIKKPAGERKRRIIMAIRRDYWTREHLLKRVG